MRIFVIWAQNLIYVLMREKGLKIPYRTHFLGEYKIFFPAIFLQAILNKTLYLRDMINI
jgi:phosphatidylglycerophosphate synthase